MPVKIAHLISDEKFPDSAFVQFEAVEPGSNDFYLLRGEGSLKYLRQITPIFVGRYAFLSPRFIKNIAKYDLVVIHGLALSRGQVACRLSTSRHRPLLVWVGMGGDYYDLIAGNLYNLLLKETAILRRQLSTRRYKFSLSSIRKGGGAVERMALRAVGGKKASIRSIDFFAPVLPNEYELVKNACKNQEFPDYVYWNYATNASMVDDMNSPAVDRGSKSLLLGNSATFTNNHLEAFRLLKKLDSAVENVYAPLSYGDEQYRAYVLEAGREAIGAKFKPVSDFMSYENYMSMIKSCAVVIMNHRRQQAAGNVSAMLHKGATVFLREENPLYQFYKGRGACIFSVQSLEKDPSLVQHRLCDAEIMKNRVILKDFIGWDAALKKTRALVDLSR